jgi:hypothetical protein
VPQRTAQLVSRQHQLLWAVAGVKSRPWVSKCGEKIRSEDSIGRRRTDCMQVDPETWYSSELNVALNIWTWFDFILKDIVRLDSTGTTSEAAVRI